MLRLLFAVSLTVLVFLILYGLMQRRVRPEAEVQKRLHGITQSEQHIRRLQQQQIAPRQPRTEQTHQQSVSDVRSLPFRERVWQPLLESIEGRVASLTPREVMNAVRQRITLAGKSREWSPQHFLTVCMLGAVTMTVFGVIMLRDSKYDFIQCLGMQLVLTLIGGYMPNILLSSLIKKRQAQIAHQLQEVLDLLCVSVQAGLSFDGALRKITDRMQGPLIDEFRRLQNDIKMGMVRRTAMRNLSARTGVQDVALFMTSLIQAERLGTSMGKTLKNQADNIRERRRQYVKAEALKAPVKIVFPLVLFIFPALFVIVLLPSLMSLMKSM